VDHGSSTRSSAPVSSAFLLLIVAFLACAVGMLYSPDNARWLVFPFVLAGFLISLCLHEFGHALVAYYCGDTTVEEKGYLTLNPLHYTDLQYSIVFPILVMAIGGIGLPGAAVYINTRLLRHRVYGALVSAGGPLATAVVLLLLMLTINLAFKPVAPDPVRTDLVRSDLVLYAAVSYLALLQVTVLVFNLLPCPGLDGWGIIEPFLPYSAQQWGRRAAMIAPVLLVLALFFLPGLNGWFWNLVFTVSSQIGLDWRVAWSGYGLFQFWR
jgi:Zn-dependent protease